MDLKVLKSKAQQLDPLVRIGKNGINENTIKEIITTLNIHKLIKIKLLKSFVDANEKPRKQLAQEIAEKTKSKLIQQAGFTLVLYKR